METLPYRFVRPMIALSGNPEGRDDTVLAFKKLKAQWPRVKVAVSAGAEKVFHGAKRPFAGFAISFADPDFREQIDSADGVLILNPSMNLVGKMANLIADCPPSVLAFSALERGLPVVLVTRPLEKALGVPGVGALLKEKLGILAGFGIRMVESWDCLVAEACDTAGPPKLPSRAGSPPVPAPRIASGGGGKSEARAPAPAHVATCDSSSRVELRPAKLGECGTCPVPDGCAKFCPTLVEPVIRAGAVRVAGGPGVSTAKDLAPLIDHTLLKADASEAEIEKLCKDAAAHDFASVCVNPRWVRLAATLLRGSKSKVCTVVGFPLGATSTEAKVCETRQALRDGADEIDMVIAIGMLKNGADAAVEEDIRQVVRAAEGRIVKVILETALLTDEEKVRGCVLSKRAGAHFVKTSTGFSTGGATVEDIKLMRATVGPDMGVKASGGIRDTATAQAMVKAGATRIGASASVAIVSGSGAAGKGY